jgi:hypothetical protein
MSKQLSFFVIGCITLLSCGSNDKKAPANPVATDTTAAKPQRFFPVTSFLKGDMMAIKQKGVNPVKITVSGQKTDSVWLTLEQLPTELSAFLQPVIDSANLVDFYKETSFQDQTINTFTFTYEPKGQLPDSLTLQRWDVYVDADNQTVKKIYMVKQLATYNGPKTMQLTWVAGRQCKMVTLKPDNSAVEKEVTILWDFNNQ